MVWDSLRRLVKGMLGKRATDAAGRDVAASSHVGSAPEPHGKWYEPRGDETIAELIALGETHRKDSLITACADRITKRMETYGLGSLSNEEKTVLAVQLLNIEVNHGGFSYLFYYYGGAAAFVVEALGRAGCPHTQAIARDALAALKLREVTQGAIEDAMSSDDDERDEALGDCDGRFFEYVEALDEKLFEYMRANRTKIRL